MNKFSLAHNIFERNHHFLTALKMMSIQIECQVFYLITSFGIIATL